MRYIDKTEYQVRVEGEIQWGLHDLLYESLATIAGRYGFDIPNRNDFFDTLSQSCLQTMTDQAVQLFEECGMDVRPKEEMRYYEFFFNPTSKLLDEGWTINEDGLLDQTFYAKTNTPLESLEDARALLFQKFPVTSDYSANLINCINLTTIAALAKFHEVDAQEFESSCGVVA